MGEVLRSRIGLLTYLAPAGSLAEEQALRALREAVSACVAAREIQIVVDLARVPALTSATLEALLDAQDRLTRMGGWVKVANPSALHRDVLLATGVDQHLATVGPTDAEPAAPAQKSATGAPRKLGEILVARGLIPAKRVDEALQLQSQTGKRMGQIILEKGWVSEPAFLEALSEQLGTPFVRLRAGLYDPEVVPCLRKATAARLRVLPLFRVRGELTLATNDPQSIPAFEEVESLTGCRVRPVLAARAHIVESINEAFTADSTVLDLVADLAEDFEVVENRIPDDYAVIDDMAAGSPIINLVNSLIQRAVRDGASDIHIEPFRTQCRVRFRIDGVLYEVMTPRIDVYPAMVSRLKVMANLDIAERRLPQDGRIQVFTLGRTVDLRFSSLPGIFGEKVVLRVLDKNESMLDLNRLGMAPETLATFRALLERSFGLILVTGPTGSGKTTTLYAAINHLNSLEKNIVTIEDPVEYQIDIVNQNQVKESIGLSFAKLLKHVLRQDPDIVMVGEIRERETASIAVQAALTGHLVLSTLHTNDSVGAVTRLLEMGIEPFMLTSALIGVVAQRLVRQVCPECKTSYVAAPALAQKYGWEDRGAVRLIRGRGCSACYDSGYKSRLGLHEILVSNGELQRLMMADPSREALQQHLEGSGQRTLFQDGLDKALRGLTTLEEVQRVVNLQ